MITTYRLTGINPQPYDPGRKLHVGPTDYRDPDGEAFVASWQAHVAAGRIGAGKGLSNEARETILANERLICGRQRTPIG
jgi:hypothetical protein